MDRSPITGTYFPQILPKNRDDELTTFRDNFRTSFQKPRRPLSPPTPAVKFDYVTRTPHAARDAYMSTTRKDFPLQQQSSSNFSKLIATQKTNQSTDHFSLETDRRLTNQTSVSSSDYSCKSLQLQPPRDHTENTMQASRSDFLGNRVMKWSNAGSEYNTSFATPSLENGRHKLEKQNDAIALGHHTCNQRSFATTSKLTYCGEQNRHDVDPVSSKDRLLRATYSSIPFGDDRLTSRLRRTDYNPPTMRPSRYDKSSANRTVYNSSWVLEEGWTNRPVTVADKQLYYHEMVNKYPKLVENNAYREQNVSSIPLGDRDAGRDSHRMSDLTSRRCHSKPPADSYLNSTTKCKQQGNVSSVPFGSSLKHYPLPLSTLADSYKPLNEKVKHVRAPPKDNINLDYCPYGYLTSSTTRESFPQRDAEDVKLKLNKAALKNLKKTHWELPKMSGQATYVTTNQLSYTVPRVQ